MAKLKLTPEPTFKTKVGISVPGKGKVPTEFTFRHKTRKEVLAWIEESKDMKDADLIVDIATGWELEDEFNAENISALCEAYSSAGGEIVTAYLQELSGARAKN